MDRPIYAPAIGDYGFVSERASEVITRCATFEGATLGEGAFRPGVAVWVGTREVAHADDSETIDVRLTKSVIRVRRAELRADNRVTLRPSGSDWIEVRVTSVADVELAMALIRDAVAANMPSAHAGPPPTGADLERRRRFH